MMNQLAGPVSAAGLAVIAFGAFAQEAPVDLTDPTGGDPFFCTADQEIASMTGRPSWSGSAAGRP